MKNIPYHGEKVHWNKCNLEETFIGISIDWKKVCRNQNIIAHLFIGINKHWNKFFWHKQWLEQ